MDSTILGSDGKPMQVDPPKETEEQKEMFGKEVAKLFRALDNRKVPMMLIAFKTNKDGTKTPVLRNNISVPEGFDLKALLKTIIDKQL